MVKGLFFAVFLTGATAVVHTRVNHTRVHAKTTISLKPKNECSQLNTVEKCTHKRALCEWRQIDGAWWNRGHSQPYESHHSGYCRNAVTAHQKVSLGEVYEECDNMEATNRVQCEKDNTSGKICEWVGGKCYQDLSKDVSKEEHRCQHVEGEERYDCIGDLNCHWVPAIEHINKPSIKSYCSPRCLYDKDAAIMHNGFVLCESRERAVRRWAQAEDMAAAFEENLNEFDACDLVANLLKGSDAWSFRAKLTTELKEVFKDITDETFSAGEVTIEAHEGEDAAIHFDLSSLSYAALTQQVPLAMQIHMNAIDKVQTILANAAGLDYGREHVVVDFVRDEEDKVHVKAVLENTADDVETIEACKRTTTTTPKPTLHDHAVVVYQKKIESVQKALTDPYWRKGVLEEVEDELAATLDPVPPYAVSADQTVELSMGEAACEFQEADVACKTVIENMDGAKLEHFVGAHNALTAYFKRAFASVLEVDEAFISMTVVGIQNTTKSVEFRATTPLNGCGVLTCGDKTPVELLPYDAEYPYQTYVCDLATKQCVEGPIVPSPYGKNA